MKCLYTRALLWWDTAGSRARSETHLRQCPNCAALAQRRDGFSKALQSGAGDLPALPAEVVARVMRQARRVEGRTAGLPSPLSTWAIRFAGVAGVLLIVGGIWMTMRPAVKPAPLSVATREIDAEKFA